ncbi:hypothetical protein COO60DRAFT_998532 [Scenedesmus sp. NREL 46B-D3]|nr:hypothetical protein COO60DRAFT_998532 [Scenedesmus sp. NREL 46B-D3]
MHLLIPKPSHSHFLQHLLLLLLLLLLQTVRRRTAYQAPQHISGSSQPPVCRQQARVTGVPRLLPQASRVVQSVQHLGQHLLLLMAPMWGGSISQEVVLLPLLRVCCSSACQHLLLLLLCLLICCTCIPSGQRLCMSCA